MEANPSPFSTMNNKWLTIEPSAKVQDLHSRESGNPEFLISSGPPLEFIPVKAGMGATPFLSFTIGSMYNCYFSRYLQEKRR